MRDVLFLAHRIPYPPNKGDKIRAWHFLRHLAERRRVHVGCFVDDDGDWAHAPVLKALGGETCLVRLRRTRALGRSLPAFLGNQPLTLAYYRDPELGAWVARLRRDRQMTAIVYSSSMAQYVMSDWSGPRIIDFVDVDSEKWREYAARKSWPKAAVYGREARTLLEFERRAAAAFDASIFVSDAEASLFKRLAPESRDRVHAIGNGVDWQHFSPDGDYPDPYSGRGASALCFTGMMDYWPNIDAVVWFVRSVFPRVRIEHPTASFWIVGANPAPVVRDLAQEPGVVVTGRVPDTRPFLAHAAAAVAPLRIARGIQNKVLEAMAMGRPVVASAQACEGIDALPGRDLLVADDADAFCAALGRALDPQASVELGRAARRMIEEKYAWSRQLSHLDAVLDQVESTDGRTGRIAPSGRKVSA